MKKMLLLLALFLSIGLQQTAIAQTTTTVTGKILDDKGVGIPGVSIQIKGTRSGTNTDVDGNFMLQLPEGHDVLIIKSSGFETQQVKVNKSGKALVVRMTPSKSSIVDISVYGNKIDPKTNVGAVSTVSAKEIDRKPITNIVQALDGQPGIQLTSGGGQPGSDPQMLIRGLGSLSANSAPLIVIDGVIYNGAMSSINPDDVASISLLKDATASSLYGARGANGVVLITMKKGRKTGKPEINISAQTGLVSNMLPQYKTLNQAQYYKEAFLMVKNYAYKLGQLNTGNDPNQPMNSYWQNVYWNDVIGGKGYNDYNVPADNLLNWVTGDVNPNAKLNFNEPWLQSLQRTGLRQQYNVSTSNGNDHSNYYFSLGYNNDQGIAKYTNFQRVTTVLNVNADITSWLKTGINTMGTYEDQRFFNSTPTAYINPFFSAQMIAPIYPVYIHDDQGNLVYDESGNPMYDIGLNPQYDQDRPFATNTNAIASLQLDDNTAKNYTFRGTTFLEGTFLKDFTARVDYTLEYFGDNGNVYQNMSFGDGYASGGVVNQSVTSQTDYTFRQRLTWTPSFGPFASGEHSLSVTLDHENYLLSDQEYALSRAGFTDPIFKQGSAAAYTQSSGSAIYQLATESYLALATYDYKKKYFLKASIRRDGTSRFSPTARWGNFWAVGGGWIMSEESFMDWSKNWLSLLKPRVSYGIQGNEDLGGGSEDYAWLPSYAFSPNATQPGVLFYTYGNPDLHWEGSYKFDVGIDFGLLNNRVSGTLDYYRRGSKDLLYYRPLPPSTGIGGIRDNVGNMQNTGVEVTISGDIIRTRNFTWNAQLNFDHNKNKITKVQGSSDTLLGGGTILTKGLAEGTFFMPVYAGVNPKNGDELWKLADGTDTSSYAVASLPENERVVGSPWRDIEGALINTLTYKNISLSFQLDFGLGGKYYDGTYASLMGPSNAFQGMTWSPDILNSWTPLNTDASLPRTDLSDPNIGSLSNRFLINASFLKIQTINLTYTLPARWTKGAKFRSASIFLAAENVYLFTAREGTDVQASFFGSNSFSYAPYRTVMFGIKLGL